MTSIANGESGLSVRTKLNNVMSLGATTSTGTSYTLTSSDEGKLLLFDNAATVTVVVPEGLPSGFFCMLAQLGLGQVTVDISGAATVNSLNGSVLSAGQYAVLSIYSYDTDTYLLAGMLD